jgi:hypothetical protein
MAAAEGLHRVRLVGKAILAIGLFFDAVALVGCITADVLHMPLWTMGLGPLGIGLSTLGAAILLAAWIAEGFTLPPQPPGP